MLLRLCAVFALLSASLAAHADAVYNYVGQDFTVVTGPYTTSDRVTGSFTIAAPLGHNITNIPVTFKSFTFSDGVQTVFVNGFTGDASDSIDEILVSTDAQGNITDYKVSVQSDDDYIELYDRNLRSMHFDQSEHGAAKASNNSSGSFSEQVDSVPSAITPEPSSFILLGTGLLGVAGVMKRRSGLQ